MNRALAESPDVNILVKLVVIHDMERAKIPFSEGKNGGQEPG